MQNMNLLRGYKLFWILPCLWGRYRAVETNQLHSIHLFCWQRGLPFWYQIMKTFAIKQPLYCLMNYDILKSGQAWKHFTQFKRFTCHVVIYHAFKWDIYHLKDGDVSFVLRWTFELEFPPQDCSLCIKLYIQEQKSF